MELQQVTSTILMVRPIRFRFNEETAVNNYYQKELDGMTADQIQDLALKEFDDFVDKLRSRGVYVKVIQDTSDPSTPDSIFPNNWISFHEDGHIGIFPMYAENRRLERREDIIEGLVKDGFRVESIEDFTQFEEQNKFLEGTGSMVLDRSKKIAYAAVSERTNPDVINEFALKFQYTPVLFTALQTFEGKRMPIYHTNVMMAMGDGFAVICLDSIDDQNERQLVVKSLEESGKEVIEISEQQKEQFAGNMLQVKDNKGHKYMVMSSAAYASISEEQKENLLKHNKDIIHSSLNTIETLGGGSARCMMAEVFLPQNTN